MNTAVLSIIASECRSACAGEPDLEQRIFKAMKTVANGSEIMYDVDENTRFRGAMAAALMAPETTEEDKEIVKASMKSINVLSALLSGVPVDVETALQEQEAGPKPLPLMDLWRRAKT